MASTSRQLPVDCLPSPQVTDTLHGVHCVCVRVWLRHEMCRHGILSSLLSTAAAERARSPSPRFGMRHKCHSKGNSSHTLRCLPTTHW